MDILLTLAIVIVAICMVTGKGFKITINHTYDMPTEVKEVQPVNQDKLDNDFTAISDIAKSIQNFMGVNDDE